MRNQKEKKLLPSTYGLIGFVFLAFLMLLLGNSPALLAHYGLQASNTVLREEAGQLVLYGLGQLDNFGFTAAMVTFFIWAAVGGVCFGVANIIGRLYQRIHLESKVGSDKYVHPATFNKMAFWRQEVLEFVLLLLSLLLVFAVLATLVGYGLPVGLAYSQVFLAGVSLKAFADLLIGLAIVYLWLVALDIGVRLVSYHRWLV